MACPACCFTLDPGLKEPWKMSISACVDGIADYFYILKCEFRTSWVPGLLSGRWEKAVRPEDRPAKGQSPVSILTGGRSTELLPILKVNLIRHFPSEVWDVMCDLCSFFGHWRPSLFSMWFDNYGVFGFPESNKDLRNAIFKINFCIMFLSKTFC